MQHKTPKLGYAVAFIMIILKVNAQFISTRLAYNSLFPYVRKTSLRRNVEIAVTITKMTNERRLKTIIKQHIPKVSFLSIFNHATSISKIMSHYTIDVFLHVAAQTGGKGICHCQWDQEITLRRLILRQSAEDISKCVEK